jgi:hypothetical protein
VVHAARSISATVDGPARSLLGHDLVPPDDLPSAIAVGSLLTDVGRLSGTALAGVAVATAGIPAAYLANGCREAPPSRL